MPNTVPIKFIKHLLISPPIQRPPVNNLLTEVLRFVTHARSRNMPSPSLLLIVTATLNIEDSYFQLLARPGQLASLPVKPGLHSNNVGITVKDCLPYKLQHFSAHQMHRCGHFLSAAFIGLAGGQPQTRPAFKTFKSLLRPLREGPCGSREFQGAKEGARTKARRTKEK